MQFTRTRLVLLVAAAVVFGTVIGVIGHALQAQAKPPIYMIANNEVTNEEGYAKEYLPAARKSILEHGGVYVAAGKGIPIDGEPPKGRLVILRFESMEKLNAWFNSPEYQAANKIGAKYAKYNRMAVEGVPQQ
jgi:uncharacterized protein (DUF1330 family)